MDVQRLISDVSLSWETQILEALRRHIEIPAKSRDFDLDWFEHGFIGQALENARSWCEKHVPSGSQIEVITHYLDETGKHRTPLLYVEIPATGGCEQTVLLYGHLDKQPEGGPWDASRGLDPWKAVDLHDEQGHRLYGRGGADDGYAVFAAVCALTCLEQQGVPHARAVILIETGEESGSPDLPFYLDLLRPKIGTPSLIVALDSGCGTYDRLWLTTSLRGVLVGTLDVQVLAEAVHSGDAGGVVPDSFRIARHLLGAIEDSATGLMIHSLYADIPQAIYTQARIVAQIIGMEFINHFSWVDTPPSSTSTEWLVEQIINRTWRPSLAVTGADGLPLICDAGNVLRTGTRLKLSIRIPPMVDHQAAVRIVKSAIKHRGCPLGAKIALTFTSRPSWKCPDETPWFTDALSETSQAIFGKEPVRMGEGGTIPFMAQLSDAYPDAQFMITGVLGPGSNAHGPNEFIHVDYAKKLTASVACMLAHQTRVFSSQQ